MGRNGFPGFANISASNDLVLYRCYHEISVFSQPGTDTAPSVAQILPGACFFLNNLFSTQPFPFVLSHLQRGYFQTLVTARGCCKEAARLLSQKI